MFGFFGYAGDCYAAIRFVFSDAFAHTFSDALSWRTRCCNWNGDGRMPTTSPSRRMPEMHIRRRPHAKQMLLKAARGVLVTHRNLRRCTL